MSVIPGGINPALVDELEALLKHGTYGVAALETLVDETESLLKDGTYGLSALEGLVDDLETRLSAVRAAKLDNLDNIDASLRDLFYEYFATMLDDDPDIVVTGTVGTPASLINNDVGVRCTWDTGGEYAELTFEASAYIKQLRHYGSDSNDHAGRFKLQAYINGSWTDTKTGIVTVDGVWSSWIDLTTPSSAMRWRFVCTTPDDYNWSVCELELKGVKIG